jgi:hypothetical protein
VDLVVELTMVMICKFAQEAHQLKGALAALATVMLAVALIIIIQVVAVERAVLEVMVILE